VTDEKGTKPWQRELTVVGSERKPDSEKALAARGPASSALIEQEKGISFVRFVPRPPFDARLVFTDQDTKRAAAFRLLRQRLIDRRDVHTVLCTSAHAGEGKTTLAANLALALSESSKYRVLLLEANLRNAALANLFGFDPPKGLRTQIIRHRTNPDDPWVVIQIGPPPLYILAAERRACSRCATPLPDEARFCGKCGAPNTGTVAFLDAAGFADAIQRLRQVFDYIIIDAPPVLAGGDVNLIQDSADAVVMAVRKGRSDERSLRRAVDQISPTPLAAVTMFED